MNNKLIRILIVILALCSVVIALSFCIKGLLCDGTFDIKAKFAECILRCAFISIFALFYYFSFSRNFESSGIFMPLYLLFAVLSEMRISQDFSKVSNIIVIPPHIQVFLFVFTSIMMALSLIGYCVFYDNPDKKTVSRYIYTTLAVGAVISYFLPKPQNLDYVTTSNEIVSVILILFSVCVITCLILIISDIHGPHLIRHMAALLFIASNYINIFYDTFLMNVIGTIVFVSASILIIVVSSINEIRL